RSPLKERRFFSSTDYGLRTTTSELQHHLDGVLCRRAVVVLAAARRAEPDRVVEPLGGRVRRAYLEHAEDRPAQPPLGDRRVEQRAPDADALVVGGGRDGV